MNIEVEVRPKKAYPIKITANGAPPLLLDELETRFLVADLQRVLEELSGPFVQVKFLAGRGGSGTFTYRDPSGTLQVGDIVEVPSRFGTGIATVSRLGKGSFTGNILDVTAKLSKEVLAA